MTTRDRKSDSRPETAAVETIPLRDRSAPALEALSRERLLALDRREMRAVQAYFRQQERDPTDAELETIAQTWSEHCVHKTLRGIIEYEEDGRRETIDNLLRETIFGATAALDRSFCLSVFADNAGVIAFDEQTAVAFKVETHNHPAALEPAGGAETGVGGVIRDILGVGLGARPILNTDVFCFGPLDTPRREIPPPALHPRRVCRGVVGGVRDYGNRMGIPTAAGAVIFDRGYRFNPLVFCGTIGILPRNRIAKEVRPGDLIVLVGGRTGRDGIHGATFSSRPLEQETASGVVQIGAPVTEKKIADTLLEARDRGFFRSLTDCGAGGLSSAVGELGAETGALVQLEQVPLKYAGLAPWEIWLSEAQERMVLAVPPAQREPLLALFAAEDVEAVVIGRFTGDRRLRLRYRDTAVADLETAFLHRGLPRARRRAVYRTRAPKAAALPARVDAGDILVRLLGHPNIASRERIISQYDHEVQGQSVLKPLCGRGGPTDAAVIRPLETAGWRGLVTACGINLFGALDPALSAANAIDEALRNLCAAGGDPEQAALLDNFCWGDVNRPSQLGALVRAARACRTAALAYRVPFISGKDSLNNHFDTGRQRPYSIPPTLLISALAIIADIRRTVSPDLKKPGHILCLAGRTRGEIGGSHYLRVLSRGGGTVPAVDAADNRATMIALHQAISRGLVTACHDLSEGGLAVALAEMTFGSDHGAAVSLAALESQPENRLRDDLLLFCESAGRFLLEVSPADIRAVEALFAGRPFHRIGRTSAAPRLHIDGRAGRRLIDAECPRLKQAWADGLAL